MVLDVQRLSSGTVATTGQTQSRHERRRRRSEYLHARRLIVPMRIYNFCWRLRWARLAPNAEIRGSGRILDVAQTCPTY